MRRLPGLAALLALALLVSSCSLAPGGGGYEVIAYFPRAVSVYKSSDVRVLGLPAGIVRNVEVVGDRVKITMRIDDDVPLPADVQAAIVPRSLIGERFVQLTPVWTEGQPRAEDGHVIELEEVIVPVEPDEALAALKDFLDSLDPDGLGRLITNLSEDLDGNGETLGSALEELSGVVQNFAENEDEIVAIIDNFDDFTATLTTREQQLGTILDAFAQASEILAAERDDLERLLDGLAGVSEDGLTLIAEHGARLERDVEILTRLGRSVDANLAAVEDLLDSTPAIVDGLAGAYNEDARALDLRQNFSPLITSALRPLFESLGLDLPNLCIPVDVSCPAEVSGKATGRAVRADLERSAIGTLLDLLGTRTIAAPPDRPSRSSDWFDEAVAGLLGVGG